MEEPAYFNKSRVLVFITFLVFGLGLIFLLGKPFNYSIYVPSVCRVIYVPVYFWLFYVAYLFITYRLLLRRRLAISLYIRKGIFAAFFLHLYLLLGNLIFYLFENQGLLSDIYFLYIKTAFLFSTAAISFVTVKQIIFNGKKDMVKPLLYGPFIVSILWFFSYTLLLRHFNFVIAIGCFALIGLALSFLKMGSLFNFFKKLFSKDLNIMIAVFIVAFIVRALFGVILVNKTTEGPRGYNGYLYASDDALTYDATAQRILEDPSVLRKGEVELWGNWDQFYGILLSAFYKLFGRNFYILTCMQAVLGAFIPVFIFGIGKILFSKAVGLIAAILLCFKGGIIMLSAYMGHEAIWLPMLYLFLLLLTRYFKEPRLSSTFHDVEMGFILGVLSLFRSMYFYFLPFLCLWEVAFFKNIKIRRMVHLFIIVLVSLSIILATFHLFNNNIRTINKEKAENLWYASRLSPPFQYIGNRRFDELNINFFKDPIGSLNNIIKHPIKFIVLGAKIYPLRVVAYFEASQFGFFDPIYMVNPAKIKNRFASTLEFYFTLFFLIGIFGCVFKKNILNSPVFLMLTFHILFFGVLLALQAPRLKEVSAPLVYLIGSFGAHTVFKLLSKGR